MADSLSPDDGEFSHLALCEQAVSNVLDIVVVLGDPEDRMHSGGDILQDCSSEHCSLTKSESDPAGDLSLPGEKSSVRNTEQILLR